MVRVTRSSARTGLAAASATAAFAVALAVAHTPQAALAQTACEALVQHALPNAQVLTATAVGAGQFESPGGRAGDVPFTALPAFCRVEASLHPTSDSDIRVELWLPASGWNRAFLGVGNRGWGGSMSYGLPSHRRRSKRPMRRPAGSITPVRCAHSARSRAGTAAATPMPGASFTCVAAPQ